MVQQMIQVAANLHQKKFSSNAIHQLMVEHAFEPQDA